VSVAEFSAPAKTHGDDEDTSGTFPTVISLPFPPRRVSGDERVLSREAAIPPDKVPPKEPTGERRFDRITPVDDGILERVDVREGHPEFEIELKRLLRCAKSTVPGEPVGEAGWAERRRADGASNSGSRAYRYVSADLQGEHLGELDVWLYRGDAGRRA
jgi:hypothetical protein